MQNFQHWFTRKFLEWQLDNGESKTLSDFADHLGISQQMASFYKNGKGVPGGDNLYRIGRRYPEVYEVLGVEKPTKDNRILDLVDLWPTLAEELKDWIMDTARKGKAIHAVRERKDNHGRKPKKTR